VVSERATTTVPAQSLYLMNNPFVIEQAGAAAERLLERAGSDEDRARQAYLLFFGRPATDKEAAAAAAFVKRYADTNKATPRASWAALCQALYASAEFLYVN
jgi:hypothetical protein